MILAGCCHIEFGDGGNSLSDGAVPVPVYQKSVHKCISLLCTACAVDNSFITLDLLSTGVGCTPEELHCAETNGYS